MREDAVKEYLLKAHASWEAVAKLLEEEKLIEVNHRENKFYLRKFQRRKAHHL